MAEYPLNTGPEPQLEAPPSAGSGAVATYVSLFLILFVFFIVLFSIAAQDQARRRAVLSGLDAALGHVPTLFGVPGGDETPPQDAATGRFVADVDTGLAALPTPGRRPGPPRPGTILNVELPPESLFAPGTPALQPAAAAVVARLAVLMQRRAGGGHYRLEISATAATPDDAALARARVAVMAARLYADGCPADAVTAAVAGDDTAVIRLDFLATPGDAADN